MMDFSNFDPRHPLYANDKARQLCLWKEEMGGKSKIKAVIGLRSKVYAMQLEPTQFARQHASDVKKCKGVKTVGLGKLSFEDYKRALFDLRKIHATFHVIRHRNYQLTLAMVKKVALAAFDNKRCVQDCHHTYPIGSIEPQVFNGQCRFCCNLDLNTQHQMLQSFLERQ